MSATNLTELIRSVSPFFPKQQLKLISQSIFDTDDEDNEESRAHFMSILETFRHTFQNMPKTYETEQQETAEKIVYLHYFVGGCDWWIIEKDMEQEQYQAFGVAHLNGHTPEFGYISIDELTNLTIRHSSGLLLSVELDFYWQPTRLKDIPELSGMFFKE